MSNQAVEVEILGKLTRVNCPAGQEESLIRAAQDLNSRIEVDFFESQLQTLLNFI